MSGSVLAETQYTGEAIAFAQALGNLIATRMHSIKSGPLPEVQAAKSSKRGEHENTVKD